MALLGGIRRMEAVLADTSLFIAQEQGRELRADPPEHLMVSVVTIGELRWGVLAAPDPEAAAQRLDTLLRAQRLNPLPVNEAIAATWANLRIMMRRTGQRLPINDSWIAATAKAWRIPLVTLDDDYERVPGLEVIRL